MADDAKSNKDAPDLMNTQDMPEDEIERLQREMAKGDKKDES